MTPEEELIDLRNRFEKEVLRAKRERINSAVLFGGVSLIGLIVFVFWFFQFAGANKDRVMAERARVIAEEEVASLKKQVLVESEKLAACERTLTNVNK